MTETLPAHRAEPAEALRRTGVVAVLRADTPEHLLPAAGTLADAGLVCLELTLTTPGALDALERLRKDLGDAADLGMGSVRSVEEARRSLDAGAGFLVSPGFRADVVAVARQAGVPVYPAGLTPTELAAAWDAGATAVKLFPASTVGPAHLKAFTDPYPDVRVMPSGGIGVDDVGTWIRAGALAVGLGGALSGDALAGGDLGALADRARRALDAVAEARS
ncbi:bifunctional 4-hydroxy-2-oxoglutarate aldolase/2-dehydro-3-deoxy-phosphogluconate aldolase [Streptomyces phaeochromogenes]|uniref:Bifunctional 4-hydroxy-2-oxoglutarate aldolase/2-dehydro-3-deoxy-phosphogluconate aldolase n=1 Tax=Streptomyces phaeochromogenes TaxID=1923 RepID=A0ABZ1HMJ2_STRPH|nr:bifunctional 4-hydroxy-2-oxoglutarate aldolase/2-dehydro-3-deoxy-phosphogluconate aldolase [Streptomyces phaeochromogenes]WSD19829.1 bifunctional 4-hydroxy-2-oxoglutarate aldolase/2-dehydro-3-deoxy-phosphogluconate aldolase [Streptomyces phaeochromogenes]